MPSGSGLRAMFGNSPASHILPYVAGCNAAAVLAGLRDALVGVGHRTRSRLVKSFQLNDVKFRLRNEFVNLTVQMAAAPDPLPYWRHPVLPGRSTAIRRAAM